MQKGNKMGKESEKKDCENCMWGDNIDDHSVWCDEREEYVKCNYRCSRWKEQK